MHQPTNALAPWSVTTENGGSVSIDDEGLTATNIKVTTLKFSDGSMMTSAGVGLPHFIDSGIF